MNYLILILCLFTSDLLARSVTDNITATGMLEFIEDIDNDGIAGKVYIDRSGQKFFLHAKETDQQTLTPEELAQLQYSMYPNYQTVVDGVADANEKLFNLIAENPTGAFDPNQFVAEATEPPDPCPPKEIDRSSILDRISAMDGEDAEEKESGYNYSRFPAGTGDNSAAVVITADAGVFKEGCEALEGGVETEETEKLRKCIDSIKSVIFDGTRDGTLCNMYKNLRPEEQHFAAMMFTSIGEAGIITAQNSTPDPKYQEALFVMKSIDNRTRKAQSKDGGEKFNGLDIALAKSQYSMYNPTIFQKHFKDLFNPNGSSFDAHLDKSVEAYIALQSNPEDLEPKGEINGIGNYYNPFGMVKNNTQANRDRVRSLKAQGKIPQDHPENRQAPKWNFDNVEMVEDLSYKGAKGNRQGDMRHYYYRFKNDNVYIGEVPPEWRNKPECQPNSSASADPVIPNSGPH